MADRVPGFQRSSAGLNITTDPPEGTPTSSKVQILDALEAMGKPFEGTWDDAVGLYVANALNPPEGGQPNSKPLTMEQRLMQEANGGSSIPPEVATWVETGDPPAPEEPEVEQTAEQQLLAAAAAEEEEKNWIERMSVKVTDGVVAPLARGGAQAMRTIIPGAILGTVASSPWGMAAAGLATVLGEPVTKILNWITGKNFASPREGLSNFLSRIGVPESDTKAQQLLEGGAELGMNLGAMLPTMSAAAAGPSGALPAANPGVVRNMLSAAGQSRPGPVAMGEIAENFAGEYGGQGARAGAEALGIENEFILDLVDNVFGMAASVLGGGFAESAFELRRTTNDLTSVRGSRARNPEDPGRAPLTRSEIDEGEFMSTARGKNFQGLGEGIPRGTIEMRNQRFWQNQQQLKAVFDAYGVEVDDLGGIPDVSAPLMDDFLATRGKKLTEGVELRDYVISQTPDEVVPLNKTNEYLESLRDELTQLNDPVTKQTLAELQTWEDSIQDLNFGNLNTTRRNLRGSLAGPEKEVIRSEAKQTFDQLYKMISEDMGSYLAGNDSAEDLAGMWARSQSELSGLADELNNSQLKAIVQQGRLNPDNVTPEMITNRLLRGEASDTERVMRGLSEDGQNLARQAFIADLARKQDMNDLSPNQFADDIAAQADQAGVIFPEDTRDYLVGVKKWFDETRRAEQAVRGDAPGRRGFQPGAMPAGGTMMSAPIRGNFWAGVAGTVAGVLGLGKITRVTERWPYIADMMRDLANFSSGSPAEARAIRMVGLALESRWAEMMENEPEGSGDPVSEPTRVASPGTSFPNLGER